MTLTRKLELAWAAGLIDGEGCIAITRYSADSAPGCLMPRYVLILKEALVEAAKEIKVKFNDDNEED